MLRKILKFNFYLLVVALILGIFLNDESSMKIVDGDLMYSTTHLNVRSRPDADSKKVNVLQPNTPLITSLSDDDNWMVVAGLDSVIIGYSSSKYLSRDRVAKAPAKTNEILSYSVHEEEVYDAPIKTQLTLRLIVEDEMVTKSQIIDLLNSLYTSSLKRTGFKYHKNPTRVSIFAYSTEKKANSGSEWLGMIQTQHDSGKPSVKINDLQMKSLKEIKIEKWNLEYDIRVQLWESMLLIELRAQNETDSLYRDKTYSQVSMKKRAKNVDRLIEKYENNLADEYKVDLSILDSISYEAANNGWSGLSNEFY